jgi:tyrosine decarboxylase / aspartate 1-decarboxylase
MYWESLSYEKIKQKVFEAINQNISYRNESILGIPGTFLDQEEFYDDAPFLKNAPFLKTLIENPNHIGCHTLTQSETVFKGTQKLEVELIRLIAEQIFQGEPDMQDGYIASGGTEANIEAVWIYRNYFKKEFQAKLNEIALVYSEDSHYSMPKAANILGLDSIILTVDLDARIINQDNFKSSIQAAIISGKKYFIVVMNLSTTMFGSVDDVESISSYLDERGVNYKIHVDGAFGGFIYPFTNSNSVFNFANPKISSITIDGHKMLQSPYGTGIFLIRKGFMKYVCTEEALYVHGKDYTICGSRSGANAISMWMILMRHGYEGWNFKMKKLNNATSELCFQLEELGVKYFRNPFINIIAIRAEYISEKLAKKYYLVADSHEAKPIWYKIVLMAHIKKGTIDSFISDLKSEMAY